VTYNGSGTVEDPYLIDGNNSMMLVRLQGVGADSAYDHFLLTADIDASATQTWNGGFEPIPIGAMSSSFYGSLDGGNHSISNLYIDQSDFKERGLFENLNNGDVRNLRLINITVERAGGDDFSGAIAGKIKGSTTTEISNVQISGDVVGDDAGGIAGANENDHTLISNVSFEGNVTGDATNGGFFGESSQVTIDDAYVNLHTLGGNYQSTMYRHPIVALDKVGFGSSSFTNVYGVVGTLVGDAQTEYTSTPTTANVYVRDDGASYDEMTPLAEAQMTGTAAQTNMTFGSWGATWQTTPSYPELILHSSGAAPANLTLEGVPTATPSPVTAGATVTISAQVNNSGGQTGSETFDLSINGSTIDSTSATVAVGVPETVEFSWTPSEDDVGSNELRVNGSDAGESLLLTITVNPANTPPTVTNRSVSVTAGQTVDGNVVASERRRWRHPQRDHHTGDRTDGGR
jgi:hypothetical protein